MTSPTLPRFGLPGLVAPRSLSRRLGAAATLLALAQAGLVQAAQCNGQAPTGELHAQRIESVKPSHAGFSLFEGPVWVNDALYFSDFSFTPGFPSRIRKLAPDGSVSTVLDDSGSNGLALDGNGGLVVASHTSKSLWRFQIATGKRSPVAEHYQDAVFNSPNDIAIATDGTLYFTDPDFQKAAAPGGQPVTGVYRVARDGKVTLVDGTLRNPNGIALSADGKVLYVVALSGVLRRYPVVDGVPQAGRDIVSGLVIPDGMALDCHGNLYVTEHSAKRVRVFSPSGKELATIRTDANITNAAFGGLDGKTLYLTGAGALWQVRLDVSGTPY